MLAIIFLIFCAEYTSGFSFFGKTTSNVVEKPPTSISPDRAGEIFATRGVPEYLSQKIILCDKENIQEYICEKMFEYIDRAAPQLNDLISNIEIVDRRGKARYGEDKFNEGKLTTGKTDHDIMIECNWRPNIKVLREFMVDIIKPESVTETISMLVIPTALVYADTEKKCVVCLEKKEVLVWPCYHSHVTCVECTIELSYVRFSCPICRASLDYKYGKWYMRRPTLE